MLLTTGLIGAERLRRASQIVSEGPVPEAAERLRAALGVGRRVTVAVCDHLATPLMVGIVRPPILLAPAALTGWSADQLEMVLLHELAHVRRWDNLVNLLQRVVESLLFFHPAVWIVSRWVRRDREDCCDAVVVARTAKPQAYAELLVALASPSHPLAGLALARHPLAGRIRRILHLEDETMLVPRNTLVAITTSLLAIVLAVSCYNLRHTEAEEVTTNETDSTNQEIDNSVVDKVIEPGKTMVQFFPHPTAPEVVSEAVKKLNRIGHNVTARPTEHGTALLIEDGVLQSQTSPGIRKSSTVRFNGTPQQDESATLFYDDIPFDGWRHFWKTELKTENRIECIKALAAFGRAGKGKEAVEAILEVVKEYDWTFISGTPLGRLKMAAIEAMGGTDHDQGVRAISTDDWLPVLTKEVLAGNKRIIAFAGYVYPEAWIKAIRASDEEAIQRMNQALRDMGPLAVPYLLPHLLRSEVMDRAVVDADGNVHSQKTESNMAAADVLREITGSDETAIKHLESLVGDITSRPVPKWEKEQAKLTLQRLKSRQEQQPRGLSRVPK